MFLATTKYPERHLLVQFFERVVARLRVVPGIERAAAVSSLPMQPVGVAFALPFTVEGQPPPETEDPRADVRMVTAGYFETMRIRLISGRFLDERDTADSTRTSVIARPWRGDTSRTAHRWDGLSRILMAPARWWHRSLDSEPKKQVYLPLTQSPVNGMAIVARTERDSLGLADTIRQTIWEEDAQQPIYALSTMDQFLAHTVFLPRFSTHLITTFASAALLLAALGLYGLLSYAGNQRTRETGLRMALGAASASTVGLIVRNSVVLVVAGVGVGLVAASALARSMAGILYGISPFDLPALGLAAGVLCAAGVCANLVPALRATRVDPMMALRD